MNPILRTLLFARTRSVVAVNTVTWNPSDFTAGSFSNGNLTFTAPGTNGGVRATHASNKKKYFELTLDNVGSFSLGGFETLTAPLGGLVPADAGGGGSWYWSLAQIFYGANGSSSISGMPNGVNGDVAGFAVDGRRQWRFSGRQRRDARRCCGAKLRGRICRCRNHERSGLDQVDVGVTMAPAALRSISG